MNEFRLNGLYEKYTGKDLSWWTAERRKIASDYWNMMEDYPGDRLLHETHPTADK